MEKVKKVAKYITNILAIINALLIGLSPIWGWTWTGKVTDTIVVIMAVIGTYLLGDKAVSKVKEK